jgi:hypothetical protein
MEKFFMSVNYLSSAANEEYSSDAFAYISDQKTIIDFAAQAVGVSGAAIAGAMAEENTAYDWMDWVLDRFAVVKKQKGTHLFNRD